MSWWELFGILLESLDVQRVEQGTEWNQWNPVPEEPDRTLQVPAFKRGMSPRASCWWWVQQAFVGGAPGDTFSAQEQCCLGTMDCNLNDLAREKNGVFKGQKGCLFTHSQGLEQAENWKGTVYILSCDTIIKSLGRLIGMVSQQPGKSKGNN